ncbi:MAG: hypothetical protein HYY18_19795 [Planctomycetes bacterium]|nr:hypothetical protein [Planctomycetota bacterium]
MRSALVFLALAGLAGAQEIRAVSRSYDIRSFTRGRQEEPAPSLEVPGEPSAVPAGSEDWFRVLDADSVRSLLADAIEPGTWDTPPNRLEEYKGWIEVQAPEATQERVAAFLETLARRCSTRIAVDAEVLEFEPGILEATGAGAGVLDPETERAIREAALDPARGKLVAALRTLSLAGRRVHAADVRQSRLLQDFDIEIAQGAAIADPIVPRLLDGSVLDVVPMSTPDPGVLLLVFRFACALPEPLRIFDGNTRPEGRMQQPARRVLRAKGALPCPVGRTVLLAAGGSEGVAGGRTLAVLVRATRVAEQAGDLPYRRDGRVLRIVDTGGLVATVPDFPAPRIDFDTVVRDDAGSNFVVPEERGEGISGERIGELVRASTGEEAWDDGESALVCQGGLCLLAGPEPRVEAAEAVVASLLQLRRAYVAVDAVAVALETAPRGEARDPATLLDRARRRDGARIAAAVHALGLNGQRFHAWSGAETLFVASRDVEIAQEAGATDPVTAGLRQGLVIDVRAEGAAVGKRLRVQLRAQMASEAALESLPAGNAPGGELQRASLGLFTALNDGWLEARVWTAVAEGTRTTPEGRTETVILLFRVRPLETR